MPFATDAEWLYTAFIIAGSLLFTCLVGYWMGCKDTMDKLHDLQEKLQDCRQQHKEQRYVTKGKKRK